MDAWQALQLINNQFIAHSSNQHTKTSPITKWDMVPFGRGKMASLARIWTSSEANVPDGSAIRIIKEKSNSDYHIPGTIQAIQDIETSNLGCLR